MIYTLSIILNFHKEGILADKTIQNLRNIVNTVYQWEEIEIIAVLDNADEKTKSIIYAHSDIFNNIEEVNYKDPSEARNHGIVIAKNEFILLGDGDDYCSHNMLRVLYDGFSKHYGKKNIYNPNNLAEENHIVLFHKYLIEFPELFHLHSCDSSNILIQNSRFTHYYTCKIATHSSLLKKNKFKKNTLPYGYEDWDLNNRLLAKGVQFKVVDYKLYYRKKITKSVLQDHINQKTIVRNSKIYSNDVESLHKNFNIKRNDKYAIFKKVSKFKFLNKLNRKILFKEDRDFLKFYGEKFQYREILSHHSHVHLIQELSLQTKYYNAMIDVLVGKEIICLCSEIQWNKKYMGSVDKVYYLNLEEILDGWNLISEEHQLHIFIKAIINSKVKTIIVGDSELGKKSLQYHHLIYKEYGINIRSIA